MTENAANWEPSENQKRVLAAAQDDGYEQTIEKMCDVAGINRRTYYRWFDDQGFLDWWQYEADKYFIRQLPRVQRAAVKASLEKGAPGSVADRKLVLERFDKGFAPRTRQEQHHTGNVTIEQLVHGLASNADVEPTESTPDAQEGCAKDGDDVRGGG
jgi:hypothetical protein